MLWILLQWVHFDRHKGLERLKKVFRRDINNPELYLLETEKFTFGSPPRLFFFPVRPLEDRLGERIDSRDSSASSRSRQPGSTSLEKRHEGLFVAAKFGSVVCRSGGEGQREPILRRSPGGHELGQITRESEGPGPEIVGLTARFNGSSRAKVHYCVDRLKAHDAHFS